MKNEKHILIIFCMFSSLNHPRSPFSSICIFPIILLTNQNKEGEDTTKLIKGKRLNQAQAKL
jgi:hypothetical protein